ncbi:MAG: hypothetical protein GPOALKHO_001679 [Sodalis sp.]|nr:MAG: hypothetical protein GPOALKHO_001679 [Sodalis sp.]
MLLPHGLGFLGASAHSIKAVFLRHKFRGFTYRIGTAPGEGRLTALTHFMTGRRVFRRLCPRGRGLHPATP